MTVRARAMRDVNVETWTRVRLGIRSTRKIDLLYLSSVCPPRSRGLPVRRTGPDPRLNPRRRLIGVNEAGEKGEKTPAAKLSAAAART